MIYFWLNHDAEDAGHAGDQRASPPPTCLKRRAALFSLVTTLRYQVNKSPYHDNHAKECYLNLPITTLSYTHLGVVAPLR